MPNENPGRARGVVTWIALYICYPNGTLKSAGWGNMWIAGTQALIFDKNIMTEDQKRLFRGRRRLRKPAWGNRPTLIRQTRTGPDEPICSLGEFQPTNASQNCDQHAGERGAVQKVTFEVATGGKYYMAVLNEKSIPDTSALILNRAAMSPAEQASFDGQPAAIAVRRLLNSSFELVCFGPDRSTLTMTDSPRGCGGGELSIYEPA